MKTFPREQAFDWEMVQSDDVKCINYKRDHWAKIDRKNSSTQSSMGGKLNFVGYPGGESTDMHCAFEDMKPRGWIADAGPISFLHLSQSKKCCQNMKKEGQMLCNSLNTQPLQQFYSSLQLWCWEGKQSLYIHSWVNYLSLSCMATDMIFEMEKPQNVVMIAIDKHSHVWLPDFLLLFHCAFEVLREWERVKS